MEKARKYLNEFINKVDSIHLPIAIDNSLINMVINEKIVKAKENGIKVKYQVNSNQINRLRIEEIDVYVLLGNALDNAIENCGGDKVINICIQDEEAMVKFIITNGVNSSILHRNPTLKTMKGDTVNHGYGIYNMREIVKKINGEIQFYEEEGLFCCEFFIPT